MEKVRNVWAISKNFENVCELYKDYSPREMYETTLLLFKMFTGKEPPEGVDKNYVDRDYLEVSIVMVSFIHCISYDIDYTTFKDNVEELGKLREKNKLLKYMLDLKFELFGKDIFDELGMEIVERVENGLIVIDKNKYS